MHQMSNHYHHHTTICILSIFIFLLSITNYPAAVQCHRQQQHRQQRKPLRILQIVPGFTNSHVLFNYRLADALTQLGNHVTLWTQMEMSMVFTGDFKLPAGVEEIRVPIQFKDRLKVEGLKVFQEMIFASGTPYELWWTGREFKDMRLEACEQMLGQSAELIARQHFDVAIGHFHDFCPVALAHAVGVKKMIWITHGPSLYDFTSISFGLRTFPAFVPHPLSSNSHQIVFIRRVVNILWHLSAIEFVNLPNELLHEENALYRKMFPKAKDGRDLWALAQHSVNLLLLNGERFLDFPRPLPLNILHLGNALSGQRQQQQQLTNQKLDPDFEAIYTRNGSKGVILFSMGTVSNTTNMPPVMAQSFLFAFGRMPEYDILWKTEQPDIGQVKQFSNVHLRRWIPQKQLIKHPRTVLLLAHGGYNSFLEAAQAGVPVVLVPLFADQGINAERAKRFGIAETLDKLALSAETVENTLRGVLANDHYRQNARKLSAMLMDKPPSHLLMPSLEYALKLALAPVPEHFALKAAQQLSWMQYHCLDLAMALLGVIWILSSN